ncbi:hypothetical protein BDK51DRAFT_52929 [Blyttiomyces helicus]|uniref:Uncharacterized protein n=1 Tax=Blyttiomyces helicus TaxID=388810 RepID=A0A4P9W0W9_9FUNG|nr:hypothetical protein BDK51DRAFT_52929 [Blyttiomyces helicus]|eukprot:RKO83696.1 hypothetical protein BDK51DRAFT_52929 [Blyttiomyces helicus]
MQTRKTLTRIPVSRPKATTVSRSRRGFSEYYRGVAMGAGGGKDFSRDDDDGREGPASHRFEARTVVGDGPGEVGESQHARSRVLPTPYARPPQHLADERRGRGRLPTKAWEHWTTVPLVDLPRFFEEVYYDFRTSGGASIPSVGSENFTYEWRGPGPIENVMAKVLSIAPSPTAKEAMVDRLIFDRAVIYSITFYCKGYTSCPIDPHLHERSKGKRQCAFELKIEVRANDISHAILYTINQHEFSEPNRSKGERWEMSMETRNLARDWACRADKTLDMFMDERFPRYEIEGKYTCPPHRAEAFHRKDVVNVWDYARRAKMSVSAALTPARATSSDPATAASSPSSEPAIVPAFTADRITPLPWPSSIRQPAPRSVTDIIAGYTASSPHRALDSEHDDGISAQNVALIKEIVRLQDLKRVREEMERARLAEEQRLREKEAKRLENLKLKEVLEALRAELGVMEQ